MPRLSHSPPETFHPLSHASLLEGIFLWPLMLSKDVIVDVDCRSRCIRLQFYIVIQLSITCKNIFVTYSWRIVSVQLEPSSGRYTYLLIYILTYSNEENSFLRSLQFSASQGNLLIMCYLPRPIYYSRFDYQKNIWLGLQIIKLLII
jgi:hypothetical protein